MIFFGVMITIQFPPKRLWIAHKRVIPQQMKRPPSRRRSSRSVPFVLNPVLSVVQDANQYFTVLPPIKKTTGKPTRRIVKLVRRNSSISPKQRIQYLGERFIDQSYLSTLACRPFQFGIFSIVCGS